MKKAITNFLLKIINLLNNPNQKVRPELTIPLSRKGFLEVAAIFQEGIERGHIIPGKTLLITFEKDSEDIGQLNFQIIENKINDDNFMSPWEKYRGLF